MEAGAAFALHGQHALLAGFLDIAFARGNATDRRGILIDQGIDRLVFDQQPLVLGFFGFLALEEQQHQ